jgi:hypothetical protein
MTDVTSRVNIEVRAEVVHLMHDERRSPHRPTNGVRVDGDRLVYDVGATPPLLES